MQTEIIPMVIEHTWIDRMNQVQEVLDNFRPYVEILKEDIKENKNNQSIVERQISGSIITEAEADLKESENRLLVEFCAYTEDDIKYSKLTKREQLVLKHKMTINRFIKIDELLDFPASSSYIAYQTAIKKLQRYTKYRCKNKKLNVLSQQQQMICELQNQDYSNEDIAKQLNTSLEVINTQVWRINSKINFDLKFSPKGNLSKQQQAIFNCLQKGMANKEIAEVLKISASSVKTQKSRIKKLGYL